MTLSKLQEWWARGRRMRRARRALDRAFRGPPGPLEGTSLRPEHCGRTQVLDVKENPFRVLFGIVRHPRPYLFSRQSHEVMELYCYHVEDGRIERLRGRNLTVESQEDGRAPDHGPAF